MRYYVVRPTNGLSVAACIKHQFGVLLSPIDIREGRVRTVSGSVRPLPGLPYVLDNGAWACHVAGLAWEPGPMLRLAERLGSASEWMVLPDIVGGGVESLARSISYYTQQRPEHVSAWMLAVQDGMTVRDVRPFLDLHPLGIFVGGSTDWKWRTAHEWAELGLDFNRRVHVGRVNSQRRVRLCRDLGVSSCDGSSVSRYSKNAPGLALHHDGDSPVSRNATMTITLTPKPAKFSAAHSLACLGEPCSRKHGHTWLVYATFRGDDSLLVPYGILVPYGVVRDVVDRYDHQDLDELLDYPATGEMLAREIGLELQAELIAIECLAKVIRVELHEDPAPVPHVIVWEPS